MDYKEEYQKALERAKKGLPIDEVFPELKESEDERIRKALLYYHRNAPEQYTCGGLTNAEVVAWLERQKEQQPAEWSAEDEEMLDAMIDIVSHSLYEPLCPREGMLAWLVSLRPYPHWKPSEEQPKVDYNKFEKLFHDFCESNKGHHITSHDACMWFWELGLKGRKEVQP